MPGSFTIICKQLQEAEGEVISWGDQPEKASKWYGIPVVTVSDNVHGKESDEPASFSLTKRGDEKERGEGGHNIKKEGAVRKWKS
ncbi:hypothetical protein LSH36_328g03010 [Paralvinella palmiformis]|uniref:Uncharacterized protein n=1 Tax=Paralvinella palmiformis TaxID=53620 RepID=A0AAD9JG99_9ANNE|nr:hypothetical protein LSH36_328g03010 [Paralvinella palmiformis]